MNGSAHPSLIAALAVSLLLTACSPLTAKRTSSDGPRPAETALAALHIRQVGFGHDARFARCMEPACPSVTPKALAASSTTVALAPRLSMPPAAASAPALQRASGQLVATSSKDLGAVARRNVVLHFGTNSALLTAAHKTLLGAAIDELRRTDRIVISGRTDDLGSESLNQTMALARAFAVRDHLLNLAPDLPARIAIDAKGRCCYTAPNDSNAGRAQNRRVELAYIPRDEGMP
jgi:outer membrane protein OmpA-like peptidoglycan-associated protein